MNLPAYFVPEL